MTSWQSRRGNQGASLPRQYQGAVSGKAVGDFSGQKYKFDKSHTDCELHQRKNAGCRLKQTGVLTSAKCD